MSCSRRNKHASTKQPKKEGTAGAATYRTICDDGVCVNRGTVSQSKMKIKKGTGANARSRPVYDGKELYVLYMCKYSKRKTRKRDGWESERKWDVRMGWGRAMG